MDRLKAHMEDTRPNSNAPIPKEGKEANNKREIKDATHARTESLTTEIRPPQTSEATTNRERRMPPRILL
jgi:hypothetical protein